MQTFLGPNKLLAEKRSLLGEQSRNASSDTTKRHINVLDELDRVGHVGITVITKDL